jgi:hypothetical protein
MTDISLRPLCYVQDVKVAVNTAFDTFYKNPDKYSNLKQLILDSTHSSGHFQLNSTDESFLYTKVGE